jgi:ssDNA-binding Zn-finger/Zn-ribbon topoisomerase 1
MATKRPAKIASAKKGKAESKHCPACDSEMQISKILRVTDASGMFWLCTNNSCATMVATSGAPAGQIELR